MLKWGYGSLLIALLVLGLPLWGSSQDSEVNTGVALPKGTLNADELVVLFSNKTVHSVTAVEGRKSVSYYAASGEIRQQRHGVTRHGRWRVTDNHRICLQMENLPEKCRIVVKEKGVYQKYIVRKNGQHQHSVSYQRFEEGNPLGL